MKFIFTQISQEKMLGYVPFETFIEIIKEQAERFDGANIIFEGLSMEALQKIVENSCVAQKQYGILYSREYYRY